MSEEVGLTAVDEAAKTASTARARTRTDRILQEGRARRRGKRTGVLGMPISARHNVGAGSWELLELYTLRQALSVGRLRHTASHTRQSTEHLLAQGVRKERGREGARQASSLAGLLGSLLRWRLAEQPSAAGTPRATSRT
jgi:hypothetical protein